jgi:gamma-glutamylcyclotransferase (GGCT)/AIG2-like uncharacterized protein YtfP
VRDSLIVLEFGRVAQDVANVQNDEQTVNTRFAFYGTLMDEPELRRLGRYLGPALIRGALYDLGAFPALVEEDGTVHGRLWAPDNNEGIRLVDWIEGYDPANPDASLYHRRRVLLLEPEIEAWAYVWPRSPKGGPRIGSGRWPGRRARSM